MNKSFTSASIMFHRSKIILGMALALSSAVLAQTTNIAVSGTTLQPSVKRMGINLSFQSFYDSGQMMKNLVFRNPGFEGEIFQSTIRCATGTASTCVDDNPYSGWPTGFWNNAAVEVFYGHAQGRIDTVTNYSAANGAVGGTFQFSSSGTAPATGDYMIIRKTIPGNAAAGWWPYTWGAGRVTTNSTDLPPGATGTQTVAISAPGPNDTANLSSYFDSTAGRTFVALNGSYQLTFKAKGTGGNNSVYLLVQRAGISPYLSQTVKLTSTWQTYTLTFNASETGTQPGTVGLTFSAQAPSSFTLDDVSLAQTNTDPSNPTAFRDAVVNALKSLNPGELRFWANQLGDTLDNLIATPFARQRSGFSAWAAEQDDISYGLYEFLQLCETVGAEPWVVVPSTFSTTEAANLIEYLAGPASSIYGARRAAAGHSAPWTGSFGQIHLEFGNEAWNGGFKGGSIEYSAPYGQRAQTIFGAMRGNPNYVASNFDLVLGGQAAWPGRNQDIQNNCTNNDTFAVAPYLMNNVDAYTNDETLFGSTFAEAEAFFTAGGTSENVANGLMLQNEQAIKASNHPVPIAIYEVNLSTIGGAISQAELNTYTPSVGAGIAVVDEMLQTMRQGVVSQNLFALPQYQFNRSDGKTVPLWGAVVDMGVTDRRRPQFLALQLANQAIGGGRATMLQTTHSGADPTWNQPLANSVQLNGAHYLQSFAFSNGAERSLIVFNLHRTSSLGVTLSGPNAPSGAVTLGRLTSGALGDNNETSAKVNISSQTLSAFNGASGLTLPPFSMTVLTWTSGSIPGPNPPPVIRAVTTTGVTGTSATISWTTDQSSTSQVSYGLTTGLGSLSPTVATLTTAHSIALSGLTPGATYYFTARSANAQGAVGASAISSFTTPATTGPALSAVNVTGITSTSATITWTTDKPSTSQVLFGTTLSYGQASSFNSSLSTSHSVTVSGLTPRTTYNFVAASVANNITGTSPNATFTTTSSTPGISGVTSTVTPASATITWSTNVPMSGQILFGTTPAYGRYSSFSAAPTTSHSTTITGLVPATTYNFEVASVDSNGKTILSSNYTFTTQQAVPVISAVAVSGITATSATITWSTDQPATSQVLFGATSAYGRQSQFNATPSTSHSITLNQLTPGATYNFAVASVSSSGTGISPNAAFVTPAH